MSLISFNHSYADIWLCRPPLYKQNVDICSCPTTLVCLFSIVHHSQSQVMLGYYSSSSSNTSTRPLPLHHAPSMPQSLNHSVSSVTSRSRHAISGGHSFLHSLYPTLSSAGVTGQASFVRHIYSHPCRVHCPP